LIRELPAFQRQRDGAFRAWLRQITVNRIRAYWKARHKQPLAGLGEHGEHLLAQLADSDSVVSRQWDQEHDLHVLRTLLAVVRPDFEAATWQAFSRFALDGLPAAEVAREMGISEGAVLQSKFRVLKRLREEAGVFLE
jgi:RNA polymerase sigma-70 factor (ECF subfamily)